MEGGIHGVNTVDLGRTPLLEAIVNDLIDGKLYKSNNYMGISRIRMICISVFSDYIDLV